METSKPKEIKNVLEIVSAVKEFCADGKYCDIAIQIGTAVFKSQRCLLAAISKYFDTMFCSNFEESLVSIEKPIVLQDLHAGAFEEILHFLYTGNVRVTNSNVYHLLFMCDYLTVRPTCSKYIEDQCMKYLISYCQDPRHLPWSDVFNLYAFSCLKDKKKLVNILSAHICQHLRHFSKDDGFMEMPFENLNALFKWSKSYILPFYGTENIMLQIILNWINHSREARKTYRGELMKNINFANVSSDFVSFLVDRLENLADEFVGSLITNPCKEIEVSKSVIATKLNHINVQFQGIVTLEKKYLKEMKRGDFKWSLATVICNLSWQTGIERKGEHLEYELKCIGTPDKAYSSWSCCANVELIIVSQKKETRDFSKKLIKRIFSRSHPAWGYTDFIRWDDLIDPEKGYIKDNSVTFKAHIETDIPCLEKDFSKCS